MSYMEISNMYKEQDILMFKECYASEKIHGCLKKGTKVMLSGGKEKRIEDIKKGDQIVSFDEKTRQFSSSPVEDVIVQESDPRLGWMEIFLAGGRTIICTVDHPFLTVKGWVNAANLSLSDDIIDHK